MCIVTFSNDDLLGFFYLDFGGFHLFLLYGNLPLSCIESALVILEELVGHYPSFETYLLMPFPS